MIPVPVLGLAVIASIVVLFVVSLVFGRSYPRQWGAVNQRSRQRLEEVVSGWPAGLGDAELRWHDHVALTMQDVREVTWQHGWLPAGEDPDGDGWPLRFTRDRRRATSVEAPPPREWLLLAELRAADMVGERVVLVDTVPYLNLGRAWMSGVATRAGWRAGRNLFTHGCVPRTEFVRAGASPGPISEPGHVEFPPLPGPAGPGTGGGRFVPDRPPLPPGIQRRYNRGSALFFTGLIVTLCVLAFVEERTVGVTVGVLLMVAAVVVWRRTAAASRRARSSPPPTG